MTPGQRRSGFFNVCLAGIRCRQALADVGSDYLSDPGLTPPDLSACRTSTRAARAAGISEAAPAAPIEHGRRAPSPAARPAAARSSKKPRRHDARERKPPPAPTTIPIAAINTPSQSTRGQQSGAATDPTSQAHARTRASARSPRTPARPPRPTTAISSAMPANPENTKAFSRSGDSTSARTSSSVAARSSGLVRGNVADDARDRRHERVRIARRPHEQAAGHAQSAAPADRSSSPGPCTTFSSSASATTPTMRRGTRLP